MTKMTVYASITRYGNQGYEMNLTPADQFDLYYADDSDCLRLLDIEVPEPDKRWLVEEGTKKADELRRSAKEALTREMASVAEFEARFLCLEAPAEVVVE